MVNEERKSYCYSRVEACDYRDSKFRNDIVEGSVCQIIKRCLTNEYKYSKKTRNIKFLRGVLWKLD